MFYIMEQENLPWPLHNVLLKRNSRVGTGTQHHVVTFQLDKSFYPTCHVCTNWQGDMSLTSTKQISCEKIKINKYINDFFFKFSFRALNNRNLFIHGFCPNNVECNY